MSDIKLFKNIWRDIRAAKKLLILGIVLYIPTTFFGIIQPLIIGYAVQYGMLNGADFHVFNFAVLFGGVVMCLGIVEYAQGLCLQVAGQTFVLNLRQKSFEKVQKLTMGFLDTTPLGSLITRLSNDAESVAEMFSMGAVQIIADLLFLIGTFILLLFVNIKLTLFFSLTLPFLAFGIYIFRIFTRQVFVKVRSSLSEINSFLQEYLSGMATVQISGRLHDSHQRFLAKNQHYLSVNRQAVFLDAAIYSFVDAMSYCASAAVLWGAFKLQIDGALQLGVLVAFLEALSRFFQPIREMSNRFVVFQSALVSLQRIYDLHQWPEEQDITFDKAPAFSSSLEFKNVEFSYQNGEQVLKGISFTLKKGERMALVGHTGAGKSTVIKLVNRFYAVTNGAILIDGKNINTLSLGEIRKIVSVVPQEVFLFNGDIKDNLRFGNENATDEDLWHALQVVQLDKMVQKKGGLNMPIAAKGHNLSLGERQLLALARALVTNPPILILDEATASVDAKTEKLLQNATKHLLQNRTALIIAHRLSTIMDADRILVFDKGHIVEDGKHSDLLAKGGIYAKLIRLQQKEQELQRVNLATSRDV